MRECINYGHAKIQFICPCFSLLSSFCFSCFSEGTWELLEEGPQDEEPPVPVEEHYEEVFPS